MPNDSLSKAVLITGCSSGIGRATAEHLAGRGWTVYASARRPESIADLERAGCKLLALDVNDEDSMVAAVRSPTGTTTTTDASTRTRTPPSVTSRASPMPSAG